MYKVQRASDDKFYALKETDLGALNQMERMDAVNEVRLLVSISHPTVVRACTGPSLIIPQLPVFFPSADSRGQPSPGLQIRYHEAFLNGNKLCVVMEYAPFGDLRYYITKGQRLNAPFPEEAIWRIFLQLCRWVQGA